MTNEIQDPSLFQEVMYSPMDHCIVWNSSVYHVFQAPSEDLMMVRWYIYAVIEVHWSCKMMNQ